MPRSVIGAGHESDSTSWCCGQLLVAALGRSLAGGRLAGRLGRGRLGGGRLGRPAWRRRSGPSSAPGLVPMPVSDWTGLTTRSCTVSTTTAVTGRAASTSLATRGSDLTPENSASARSVTRAGVVLHLGEVGLDGGLDRVEVDGLLGRDAQVVDGLGRLAGDVGDVALGLAEELVGLAGHVVELGLSGGNGRVEHLLALADGGVGVRADVAGDGHGVTPCGLWGIERS